MRLIFLFIHKYPYFCIDLIGMTGKHDKLLSDLEFRMRQLMYLCDSLKEENADLKKQLNEKEKENLHANSEIERLNIKLNNLKMANTLAGRDSESVEQTKRRLSKLVQDVEKCISLLKI